MIWFLVWPFHWAVWQVWWNDYQTQEPPIPRSHAWKLVAGVLLIMFSLSTYFLYGFWLGMGCIVWFIVSEVYESRKMRRWEMSQWSPYRSR